MRLENILALTHATLLSEPQISQFEAIVIDVSKVRRGVLFVALNPYDIKRAVELGAYGILYDRETPILDDEAAWIKVDDIYEALKRIVRFLLIDKELQAFTCSPITLQIAKQLVTPPELLILEGMLQEHFGKLLTAPAKSTILFSQIDDDLFTDAMALPSTILEPIDIIEQTLFETSFIYKDVFYERQLLSPFFIPYLEQLLQLFSNRNIAFKIRPFSSMPHFQPVFTDKALHVKDFGSSDRVIIFENDFSLIDNQIDFIAQQAAWAKIIYLLPRFGYNLETENPNILLYDTTQDIIEALKTHPFHFALVAGCDKSILLDADETRQQTLF